MSSFEEQNEAMRQRAIEANRRLNVDACLDLKMRLNNVEVNPTALHTTRDSSASDRKDYLLLRIPDLLTLAVYAHYRLQQDAKESPNGQ